MAAPHVAGVAALLLSADPLLTVEQVEQTISRTARAFPNALVRPCTVDSCGDGIIDANAALRDATGDPDGDGLLNPREHTAGTRTDLWDTDGDGMGDGFEVNLGLSPQSTVDAISPQCTGLSTRYAMGAGPGNDADCDGLPNLAEYELRTNPTKIDSDNDNVDDPKEVALGRNPAVNEPALVSIIQNLLLN